MCSCSTGAQRNEEGKMAYKCKNINKLVNNLLTMGYEKESQIGKHILRKKKITCSIYENGTVQIQGICEEKDIKEIEDQITAINNEFID